MSLLRKASLLFTLCLIIPALSMAQVDAGHNMGQQSTPANDPGVISGNVSIITQQYNDFLET